ncbi:hypothetical protein [Bordetella tumulicola]|uniref:hypothetical protein n=1 Tax=Bordetella tumulicola TaxID=1649133 RepID=UPI0039EEA894
MSSQSSSGGPATPPQNSYTPSEAAQTLYKAFLDDAKKRQLSSSENFDKSILTYSSGGLALSLAFLKDFIPIRTATMPYLLYGSWALFVLSTALTTVSFLVSYKAQTLSIQYAEKYYLEGNECYLNRQSWCDRCTKWFNLISGAAFILALVFTSIFVAINLNKANAMAGTKSFAQDGLPSAMMQKMTGGSAEAPLTKGLPAGTMAPVPPAAQSTTTAPAAPQSTSGSGNTPSAQGSQSSK